MTQKQTIMRKAVVKETTKSNQPVLTTEQIQHKAEKQQAIDTYESRASRHMNLLNAFDSALFDSDKHLYSIDGEQYQSVTTLIKQYEEEFNAHLIAYNKAGGDLEKKQAWLKYWEAKREEASWRGTRIHAYAELAPDLPEPMCKQEEGVYEWYTANRQYELVCHELRVYSKTRKIAGTIDAVFYDAETDSYVIVDWKSNGAHLGQYYGSKKMLDVFSNLNANNYNKYTIQQSLYKSILEEAGFKVSKIMLVWLTDAVTALKSTPRHGYKIEPFVASKTEFGKQYIQLELTSVNCSLINYNKR